MSICIAQKCKKLGGIKLQKLLATAKKGKQNMGTVVTFIRVHITNNLTRGVGEFIARAETGIQTIYITRIMIGGDCANLLLNEKKNPFKIMLKSKNKQCTMGILLPMEKWKNFQLLPIIIITLTNQIVWMLVLLTDILLI